MENSYFRKVGRDTPTEFWINNPLPSQAAAALEMGAVGITTNPTYPARMAKEDPAFPGRLAKAVAECPGNDAARVRLYHDYIRELLALALPLHRSSGGRFGYVAVQGDPRRNGDADFLLQEAGELKNLGENIIIKVPATQAGAAAMTELTAMGWPTIATLGFSVDQAIYMAEAYRKGLRPGAVGPRGYVTYIAGILDDYLSALLKETGNPGVDPACIRHAGCHGTRVTYRIYQQRGYEAMILGGGARGTHHFTELVGGKLGVTIGWSIARELADAPPPCEARIETDAPAETIAGLRLLPDFMKASAEGALPPAEFSSFGPVALFQGSFLKAVDECLLMIAAERKEQAEAKTRGAETE